MWPFFFVGQWICSCDQGCWECTGTLWLWPTHPCLWIRSQNARWTSLSLFPTKLQWPKTWRLRSAGTQNSCRVLEPSPLVYLDFCFPFRIAYSPVRLAQLPSLEWGESTNRNSWENRIQCLLSHACKFVFRNITLEVPSLTYYMEETRIHACACICSMSTPGVLSVLNGCIYACIWVVTLYPQLFNTCKKNLEGLVDLVTWWWHICHSLWKW